MLLSALLFTACGEAEPEQELYSPPLISDYVVIRAEYADQSLITLASELRDSLQTASGVRHIPIACAEDISLRDDIAGKKFIIVGETVCSYTDESGGAHIYTDEAMSGLSENEYRIMEFSDGTIAIVATSEEALESAAQRFTGELLGDEVLLLSSDTDVYDGSYEPPARHEYSYEPEIIAVADDCPTDMPVLYIMTEGEVRPSAVPRDSYINATMALDGMGFVPDVPETAMHIKGRGNYSWSFPKKPYNIKFDKKIDLGGLGAAKKWTLVTTYSDKTMLRNYLTLNLGLELGMEYSTECFFVNVYFNGEYRGVYLITERAEAHPERVNIDIESNSPASMWEIEMTYRHSETATHLTLASGVHMMLREPEEDDQDDEFDDETVGEIFNAASEAIERADASLTLGYDEYSKYINVDSFINWYIVNEFVKNYDSRFVTSCFCFVDGEGVVWMGPPWDYDTCMGNQNVATCLYPTGWHVADAEWYALLLRDDTFRSLLRERWAEIRGEGIILENYLAKIDGFVADHSESIEANNERWPDCLLSSDLRGGDSTYTYEDEIEYLKGWLTERTAWIDEQFGYDG